MIFLPGPSSGFIDEIKQAIETDGRPPERVKVKVSHSHILLLSNMDTRAPDASGARWPDPDRGVRRREQRGENLVRRAHSHFKRFFVARRMPPLPAGLRPNSLWFALTAARLRSELHYGRTV